MHSAEHLDGLVGRNDCRSDLRAIVPVVSSKRYHVQVITPDASKENNCTLVSGHGLVWKGWTSAISDQKLFQIRRAVRIERQVGARSCWSGRENAIRSIGWRAINKPVH